MRIHLSGALEARRNARRILAYEIEADDYYGNMTKK